jgi:hypothetical protein
LFRSFALVSLRQWSAYTGGKIGKSVTQLSSREASKLINNLKTS